MVRTYWAATLIAAILTGCGGSGGGASDGAAAAAPTPPAASGTGGSGAPTTTGDADSADGADRTAATGSAGTPTPGAGGPLVPANPAAVVSYQNEPGCLTYSVAQVQTQIETSTQTLTSAPAQSQAPTGTDPLLTLQWHLQNTGQGGGVSGEDVRAVTAWSLTKGAGAQVAVIDDAIETLHPDLAPNVLAGGSYNYRAGPNQASPYPFPCSLAQEHGTAVAGLIAARDDNAIGGAGVAPRVSLSGFNALASNSDADVADALLRSSATIGVYNNSWGSPDDGRLHPVDTLFKTTIANGIIQGRGGKGSIYVFAAGNGGCYSGDVLADGRCNGSSDNSNFDGYTNGLGVIAACAVSDTGTKPWYDEAGANALVCGVSGDRIANMVTTDLTGRATGSGYRSDFSGTSASTPTVSGVIALMLAMRPELTWRDVRLILAETARKNDPDNADWTRHFGLNHHRSYAFGVVDAQAAVARATTWSSVGGSSSLKVCGPFERTVSLALSDASASGAAASEAAASGAAASGAAASGAAIIPGATIEDLQSITAAACDINQIEFVEVRFAATHTASGDLRIRLQSPNGLVSELANARVCDPNCGDYGDASGANPWAFGSVRHLGEPTAGTWRLQVTDMLPVDIGTLRGWSLRFWGR